MMTVFDANLIYIIVALLVGIAVAWWAFGRRRARVEGEARRVLSEPKTDDAGRMARPWVDGPEGNSLIDEGAAATTDVAGQMLGVQVHAELPGADGPPDHLETMKGVGPKLAQRLNELGYRRFAQLAALSPNEVALLDDKLGPFKGRLARDRVIEQAAFLERGDRDGFEAAVGKLGS